MGNKHLRLSRPLYARLSPDKQEQWRELACRGHWRHRTIEEAALALRVLEMQGERGLNVFQCLWCYGYHVGHGPRERS